MISLDSFRNISEGSVVLVSGGFGRESLVKAKVTYVSDNIKNDTPGIEYEEEITGEQRWAYYDQIAKVISY